MLKYVIVVSLLTFMIGCKPTVKQTSIIQPMEGQCIDCTITDPDGTVHTVRVNTDDPDWVIMNTKGLIVE